jgi:hypothetical protein
VQSLSASWKAMLYVNCPHCGKVHEISVRETYIEGALDAAVDGLRLKRWFHQIRTRNQVSLPLPALHEAAQCTAIKATVHSDGGPVCAAKHGGRSVVFRA